MRRDLIKTIDQSHYLLHRLWPLLISVDYRSSLMFFMKIDKLKLFIGSRAIENTAECISLHQFKARNVNAHKIN
jgi:hypothetical protein